MMRSPNPDRSPPRARESGVTLVEAVATLFVIAAVSLFATPYFQSRRMVANEAEAARVMRSIAEAQRAFFEASGETSYALLPELLGDSIRKGMKLDPRRLLDANVRRTDSFAQSKGYRFVVYLKGVRGGTWSPRGVDPEAAKTGYVAYGWPVNPGYSGREIFVVDETGDVRRTADDRPLGVSGESPPPPADFAPHPKNLFGPKPPDNRATSWRSIVPEASK
jgi:type II secretory pathway pseudopilin PulG